MNWNLARNIPRYWIFAPWLVALSIFPGLRLIFESIFFKGAVEELATVILYLPSGIPLLFCDEGYWCNRILFVIIASIVWVSNITFLIWPKRWIIILLAITLVSSASGCALYASRPSPPF